MTADVFFQKIADFGNELLFFDVLFWTDKASLPFLIFWLLFASLYFAVITGFINFRKLPLAVISFIKGKKTINKKEGTVSSKNIVLTTTAGSIDLGSIFGVAGIIAIGGAGTLFWLVVAGFLATSVRYVEVLCGHYFRKKTFKNGVPNGYIGGPQIYIYRIFKMCNFSKIGKILSMMYAIMLCLSTFCSLQINQSVHIITHTFPDISKYTWFIALCIASFIIFVVLNGTSSVAKFNEKVIPKLVIIYVATTVAILIVHRDNLLSSLNLIFEDAFSFRAVNGGFLGAIVLGAQRAFFCNESGMGSGAIAHANSSNKDSRKEAIVSMVSPIISVLIVCVCSGMIVLVSKSYLIGDSGTDFIINAFGSINPYAKYLILLIAPLAGISTAVSWAYYGSRQFATLFGQKRVLIYYTLLFIAYFLCGMVESFDTILNVADVLNLSIAIPNVIALFMMSKIIIRITNGKNKKK